MAEPFRRYDAGMRIVDRQLVDPDGLLVAKADDLEVTEREDGRLVLTAILTGPGALGPRLDGRLGRWITAVWRRLHPDPDPQPGRIPVTEVVKVDSAVHVAARREDLGVDGLERWVDEHVIRRLPGADDEPE
jgi:hypothetical protein